jgi:hypothetical protein
MFDPAGLRPHIANWEELARTLVQRVYHEAIGRFLDEKSIHLLDSLMTHPGVKPEWRRFHPSSTVPEVPVIPLRFMRHGQVLSYFSMITTVATPQTIAAQELRIESLFPMDEATEMNHSVLMSGAMV